MAQSKIDQLLEKSEALLSEKKYYEYEQKIKTFASRFVATNKLEDSVGLLFGGAARLFQQNEQATALSLVSTAITEIKEKDADFNGLFKKKFLELLALMPYNQSKLEVGLRVLKLFYPTGQDRDISLYCADEAIKNKEYHICQKFLMKCDNSNEQAVALLKEWIKQGEAYEQDLYVARFIFIKLAINRVTDAKYIFEAFRKQLKTPLINFIGFLIRGIDIKSTKVFETLIDEYEDSYQRDPTFIKLLRRIGSVHFGLFQENDGGIFNSFFKFLTS